MNISRATVLVSKHGADTVLLHTDLPSSMPRISSQELILKFDATKGTGVDYVKKNFNLDAVVIPD